MVTEGLHAVDAIQTLTVDASGGYFTLTFGTQTTDHILAGARRCAYRVTGSRIARLRRGSRARVGVRGSGNFSAR